MQNVKINQNAPQAVKERAEREIAEGRIKVMHRVK